MPRPTVAIVHGWAEGEWQSRQFRQLIQKAGFQVSKDVASADIIFAHSSGCFQVPADNKAKLIILVGLPFWPHRSLATSVGSKLVKEVTHYRKNQQFSWWISKTLHNIWYIFTRPQASLHVITKHKLSNLPHAHDRQVLLVRPADDTFTHPNIEHLIGNKDYKYRAIHGSHDDCWLNPDEYIELIQQAVTSLDAR